MLSFKIFVDGISEIRKTWIVVVFRLCHGRLYFDGMPLIDLSLVNFGFVLQLGKIVASIEQKPVSLNDIVTYGALIKNERDY